jgi:hypothetical protein
MTFHIEAYLRKAFYQTSPSPITCHMAIVVSSRVVSIGAT